MQDSDRQTPEATEDVAQEVNISISAWMDGDAGTAMPDSVFTEAGQNAWQVYHLIGDALRTPELVRPVSTQFQQRLASAISAEPSVAAQAADPSLAQHVDRSAAIAAVSALAQLRAASPAPSSEPVLTQAVTPQPAKSVASPHRNPLKAGWRLVWPGLAMAAAVASVVWMARPFFIPESGVPVQQMASADPISTTSPAIRDYVSAHRQIAGPTGVRQASFGASR